MTFGRSQRFGNRQYVAVEWRNLVERRSKWLNYKIAVETWCLRALPLNQFCIEFDFEKFICEFGRGHERRAFKRTVASFFNKTGHVAAIALENCRIVNSDWTIYLPEVMTNSVNITVNVVSSYATTMLVFEYGWEQQDTSYVFKWFEGDQLPRLISDFIKDVSDDNEDDEQNDRDDERYHYGNDSEDETDEL
ncbi:hypothetical protein EVAR_27148_1 [Eumeta japonica]|uniref:Uncharacterized protein n=1 Tax=Eumeta variegata TaxID=151549 RepID=A0A4C1VZF7_EUMVA|nr:hypothetical protein EVAR_27148_1 [Eumeta japonica]